MGDYEADIVETFFEVTNVDEANGIYKQKGERNGNPMYVGPNGHSIYFDLFKRRRTERRSWVNFSFAPRWDLYPRWGLYNQADQLLCYIYSNAKTPPGHESVWVNYGGLASDPSPKVFRRDHTIVTPKGDQRRLLA